MTVDTLGRAFGLYRRTAASRTAIVLLIANAIPLVGVLFFGWSLMTILVLYWVENGIVGFWNVPRIALARGSLIPTLPNLPDSAAFAATGNAERAAGLQAAWRRAQEAQLAPSAQSAAPGPAGRPRGFEITLGRFAAVPRAGLAIFFVVHYGMFWLVHGIFVFTLPAFGSFGTSDPFCQTGTPPPPDFPPELIPGGIASCAGAFGEVLWGSVALGAVALFLSHGASFLFNYIGRGENLTSSPTRQMAAPYGRVVVLHLTIILGSFVVAFLGAPIGALIVLVGLKTAFDLGLHLREHVAAGLPIGGAPAAAARTTSAVEPGNPK